MTRNCSPFSVTQQRNPLPYARLFFPQGELRAGRPTGMIDPDPVVPPEPITDLDLHRGRRIRIVLVGVMDPPGRPKTEIVEVATSTQRLLKSPSLSLLTEAKRRNKLLFTKVNNFAIN